MLFRSRGTAMRTGPAVVVTVLPKLPLRRGTRPVPGRVNFDVTQMVIELGAQSALQHRPGQLAIDAPVTGKKGHGPVAVDTTVDRVAAAEFDALVIPGGYAPDKLRRSEAVLALVRSSMTTAGRSPSSAMRAGSRSQRKSSKAGARPAWQRSATHGQRRRRLGGPGDRLPRQSHLGPDPRRPRPLDEGTAGGAGEDRKLMRWRRRHGTSAAAPALMFMPVELRTRTGANGPYAGGARCRPVTPELGDKPVTNDQGPDRRDGGQVPDAT